MYKGGHQPEQTYDPGTCRSSSCMTCHVATITRCSLIAGSRDTHTTHEDEELYKAVDNVYGVIGDDAPVTEDEVIAALQRFDFDEEKAVSALLAQIGSKSTRRCPSHQRGTQTTPVPLESCAPRARMLRNGVRVI